MIEKIGKNRDKRKIEFPLETRKDILVKNMCMNTYDNISIGKGFLDYAVSRSKIALMRDSIKKVRANPIKK